MQHKVLILTAIPRGLRLDQEIRDIDEAIQRAARRDKFEIRMRTAVRSQDIRRAIAEERPQIVHFCGHGLEDGSLLLEDDGGSHKPVSGSGLAQLFKLHADYVNCVLLNACHSAKLAQAISQYISYTIGMNQEIKDKHAIAFAQGFYDALGYETPDNIDIFQRAFDEGLVAIGLEEMSQGQIPVLIKNKTLNQSTSIINSHISPAVEITPPRPPEGKAILQKPEHFISHPRLPGLGEQIHQFLPNRFSLRKIFIVSLTVTGTLIGLRFFGALEWMELKAFDNLMQIRPDEGMDKRLLIVKITDEDILAQDQRKEKGQGSLRDPSLNRLLETLQQHQPRLIGLDLYRPFSVDATIPGLFNQLRQKNIFAVCKVPTIVEERNSRTEVAPPQEVSSENIGFSDFVSDLDGTVRRHLMVLDQIPGANCRTQQSFSLLLARRYLELGKRSDYKDPLQSGENLQIDGVVFQQLQPFTGGYQDVDNRGYQVLLNYRATSSGNIAKELTLEDILNKRFSDEDVRDKIVLIGSDAEQQGPPDHWSTPYGTVNGVIVHGHMISQILSAVLDRRSLLSVLPQDIEILWIWGWSLAGGIFAYYLRSVNSLGIALISGILVLCITCFTCLTVASLWIPLIPPILALIGTNFIVIYITYFYRFRPTNINNQP